MLWLLLNAKRLLTPPVWDGVYVQVGVRGQWVHKKLQRKADGLRREVLGVVAGGKSIQIPVRRDSITDAYGKIVIRPGVHLTCVERWTELRLGRKHGRTLCRQVLSAQAGADFVFKSPVTREVGYRYRPNIILLGAEVSALTQREKALVLVVMHAAGAEPHR